MRTPTLIMQALIVGALSAGAAAQDDPWSTLEAVDAGTEDVSPLGESLRMVPIDMRVNDAFTRIYRLEGVGGWQDQFARREGALTAVFPQSVYVPSPMGVGVGIPAGTVFLIGAPPDWMYQRYNLAASAPSLAMGPTALPDSRLSTGLGPEAIDLSAPATPIVEKGPSRELNRVTVERPPMPWRTDERRGSRVSSLLTLAVTSE